MRMEGISGAQRRSTSSVALVTTAFGGVVNVMSAEWSLRVSLEPYLVAVFVGYQRATLDLLRRSGEFGLSYCSDEQAHLAHVAGNHSLREGPSKWSLARFPTFPSRYIHAPLIEGAVANLECRVVSEFPTGDHVAFVGEVLTAYFDEDRSPLVYHGGKYYRLGPRIPSPPRRGTSEPAQSSGSDRVGTGGPQTDGNS